MDKDKDKDRHEHHLCNISGELNGIVETLIDTPLIFTEIEHIWKQDRTPQIWKAE